MLPNQDPDLRLKHSEESQTAFLVVPLGGTGLAAARPFRDLHTMDGCPFPVTIVAMDTDPSSAPWADQQIHLGLDGQKARAVVANAGVFGPTAKTIVRDFFALLDPENIVKGSRTTRALTQLSFVYFEQTILKQLRDAVLHLYHQGGFTHIVPVFLSSTGGGTGSALSILLPQKMKQARFASRLTEGMPSGVVQTPILFMVEPFAFAMRNQSLHADKILANAFAFRIESAMLELSGAIRYCFHLGLASRGGTVLDTPEEIARVLGTAAYQFLYHWPQIKGRLVDTVDTHALTAHYAGQDLWERVRGLFSPGVQRAATCNQDDLSPRARPTPDANGTIGSMH